jgi:integrase
MARRSRGPRYYKSKNAYFANINGERIKLLEGPKTRENERLAVERYERLMKVRSVEVAGDRAEVGAVLNAYLLHTRRRVLPQPLSPSTRKMHEECLRDFCNFEYEPGRKVGTLPYRDLKMSHVERWVTLRKQEGRVFGTKKKAVRWSDNYVHMQLRILRTAFRWAANDGDLVGESVFARKGKKIRLPSPDLSLKRVAITEDEHTALLAQACRRKRGSFSALLEILYDTGARPAEIYLARADEWDPELQALVIDPSDPRNVGRLKNRNHLKRRGRKRVIRIPDCLVPLIKKLLVEHPEGELIRREDGSPWTGVGRGTGNGRTSVAAKIADRFDSLVRATNKLAEKKGLPPPVRPEVSLYSFRHAYTTRYLKQGGSPLRLCELLDTSLEMLQTHYSHLFEEHQTLLDDVNRFSSRPAHGPHSSPSSPCEETAAVSSGRPDEEQVA